MRVKLKLGGPRTRHESMWGGGVRVEAKAGARDAGPVITRFLACRAQAEKDRAIGDTRPFAALFSFNGCQVAVLTVNDLARILEAL